METTTLTIHLPKNISSALEDEARISGKNVVEYVEKLLSKQVKRPGLIQSKGTPASCWQ